MSTVRTRIRIPAAHRAAADVSPAGRNCVVASSIIREAWPEGWRDWDPGLSRPFPGHEPRADAGLSPAAASRQAAKAPDAPKAIDVRVGLVMVAGPALPACVSGLELAIGRKVITTGMEELRSGRWECTCATAHRGDGGCALQDRRSVDLAALGGWGTYGGSLTTRRLVRQRPISPPPPCRVPGDLSRNARPRSRSMPCRLAPRPGRWCRLCRSAADMRWSERVDRAVWPVTDRGLDPIEELGHEAVPMWGESALLDA